jgi:glycosyltransferase involved in cell wall biosynthesis
VRPIRIALYGDVNLNIIDGSAIWLASLVQVLHRIERTEVTVLRKAPPRRDVVTAEFADLPRVSLVSPRRPRATLSPAEALDELERLDAEHRFDIVLLRGYALCRLAARRPRLADRLWVYLTDIQQDPSELTEHDREELRLIATASDRLLCQTEQLRSYLEAVVPEAANATILLPPMVPPMFSDRRSAACFAEPGAAKLFYAGKFAPRWGFLETVAAFTALRRDHPELELHVAGDKIHNPPEDPDYRPAVEAALQQTDGLVWHGGVTRAQVAELLAGADIALSARHRDLDDSLELSTKVLEYGAAGVPVALNRTAMHVELFGEDYPLLVDDLDVLAGVLGDVLDHPDRWAQARDRARQVAADFTYDRVADRLRPHLERHVPSRADVGGRAPRILVASHSLKFFTAIADHLRRCGADVCFDVWEGHAKHDEAASKKLLDWAEIIICEWALGNAVWYARSKHPHQRLFVRLHRMELETEFPREIAIDAVERVVFVSELFRDKAIAQLGWPTDKLEVVSNWVDTVMLDRPKLPGARFHLGLLGWIPIRKRVDRAVDVLERLLAEDDRWRLYLGGKLPWELRWVWQRLAEQQYFTEQLDRIRRSPRLRRAVSFDGHQTNVASWMRKIGFVLSPSDDESFHLSPAEGMASGAVPVVWPWECASQVYDGRWISADSDAAAQAIASTDWEHERRLAQQYVRERYPLEPVTAAWADLVLGHADP